MQGKSRAIEEAETLFEQWRRDFRVSPSLADGNCGFSSILQLLSGAPQETIAYDRMTAWARMRAIPRRGLHYGDDGHVDAVVAFRRFLADSVVAGDDVKRRIGTPGEYLVSEDIPFISEALGLVVYMIHNSPDNITSEVMHHRSVNPLSPAVVHMVLSHAGRIRYGHWVLAFYVGREEAAPILLWRGNDPREELRVLDDVPRNLVDFSVAYSRAKIISALRFHAAVEAAIQQGGGELYAGVGALAVGEFADAGFFGADYGLFD